MLGSGANPGMEAQSQGNRPSQISGSISYTPAVVVIALVMLVAAALIYRFSAPGSLKQSHEPRIVLYGPSGAGKTSLFAKWTDTKAAGTVTSITASRSPFGDIGVETGKLVLVDTPGHEKLTHLSRREIDAPGTKAVIFMVDAASGPENVAAAGKTLYNVLAATEQRGIPVLVAANKSDLFNTISTRKIKSLLQDEIEEVRLAWANGLGQVGNKEDEVPWIGAEGKFTFEDLEQPVEVLDGSILSNRVQKWSNWLASNLA